MHERQLAARLQELMDRQFLTQTTLADLVGVSQSSVSRALRREPLRRGRARVLLVSYIQQAPTSHQEPMPGGDQVLNAFSRIWDGTEAHAAAIAKIIDATKGLGPTTQGEHPS